jgi:hypothetical protein
MCVTYSNGLILFENIRRHTVACTATVHLTASCLFLNKWVAFFKLLVCSRVSERYSESQCPSTTLSRYERIWVSVSRLQGCQPHASAAFGQTLHGTLDGLQSDLDVVE